MYRTFEEAKNVKAEYINSFLNASKDILAQMAGISSEMGKIYVKDSPFASQNVAIIIGLTGTIKGQVLINMSEPMALKIASNMMGGMPVAALDEIARSAISELGNMILGNAATLLYNLGVTMDITPPTLLVGEKISLSTAQIKTICIPLQTEMGTFEIDIAVKE
jgi:chemotaxis protein CheX